MNKFLKAILTLLSAIIMLNSTANAQVDTSTTQKLLQYIMQPPALRDLQSRSRIGGFEIRKCKQQFVRDGKDRTAKQEMCIRIFNQLQH